MKLRMAVGVCVMLLAAVVFVHAAETPEARPRKAAGGRLTQPWNKITSLSDEQKTKIREIHGKAIAEIKAIQERERDEIMALLSEEQKAEAQKMMDEQRRPRAAKDADAPDEKKAEEKKAAE